MTNNENYYYGQGRVYLSPFNNVNWRFIGDVSQLALNIEYEKKQRKTSVKGRIVTVGDYITEVSANLSMTWHNFDRDNLAILLGASEETTRQSWTEEKFTEVKAGDVITLEHTHVRRVNIEGLTENSDYNVMPTRGMITFINPPLEQPFIVDYDYAEESSIALLNDLSQEWCLRYQGVNLAENGKEIFIEFYRLTINPAEMFELINNGSELAGTEITAPLLADFSKGLTNAFGLFSRIVSTQEFRTIVHNGEIDYDFSHDFAY